MIGQFSIFGHDIVFDDQLFELTGSRRVEPWHRFGDEFEDLLTKEFKDEGIAELCFFDLVGVIPPGKSRGFVLAPSEQHARDYLETVSQLLDEGYAVAGHPVFDAGLPDHQDGHKIETPSELDTFLKRNISISDRGPARRYYRSEPMREDRTDSSSGRTSPRNSKKLHCEPLVGYDVQSHAEGVRRYGGADRSICDNLDRFAELLGKKSRSLCSRNGECLRFLYAIPVSAWSRTNDSSLWKSTHFGSIFIGVSGDHLDEALISVLETLVVRTFGIAFNDRMLKLETQAQNSELQRQQFEHQHEAITYFIHDVGNLMTVMEKMLRDDRVSVPADPDERREFDRRQEVMKRLHVVNEGIEHYLESADHARGPFAPAVSSVAKIVEECTSLLPPECILALNNNEHCEIIYREARNRIPGYLLDGKREEYDWIICDASKTRRALLNIIDNAIKYSRNRSFQLDVGWIVLETGDGLRTCVIYVSDYGGGVMVPDETLYTPFLRGEHHKRLRGFGLGLSSAKEMIRFHFARERSGDIWSFNREDNGLICGATFILEIPYERATIDHC